MFKKIVTLVLTSIVLSSITLVESHAAVKRAGYCWSDVVGWIDMASVDIDRYTGAFTGSASFRVYNTTFGYSTGEIDFVPQGALSVSLATTP